MRNVLDEDGRHDQNLGGKGDKPGRARFDDTHVTSLVFGNHLAPAKRSYGLDKDSQLQGRHKQVHNLQLLFNRSQAPLATV